MIEENVLPDKLVNNIVEAIIIIKRDETRIEMSDLVVNVVDFIESELKKEHYKI